MGNIVTILYYNTIIDYNIVEYCEDLSKDMNDKYTIKY